MYSVIRKGPKRFLDERCARLAVRSLSSSQYFTNNHIEFQNAPVLDSARALENRPGENRLQNSRNAEHIIRTGFVSSIGSRDSSAFVKRNQSNLSQEAALPLLRSTLSSPTAYRTLVYDPLYSCYGISPCKAHQADAKLFFSTGRSGTSAKIPTPKSQSDQSVIKSITSIDPLSIARKGIELTWSVTKIVVLFLARLPGNTLFYLMNSKERKAKISEIRDIIRKEVDHYWTGTKVRNEVLGHELFRSRRKQSNHLG